MASMAGASKTSSAMAVISRDINQGDFKMKVFKTKTAETRKLKTYWDFVADLISANNPVPAHEPLSGEKAVEKEKLEGQLAAVNVVTTVLKTASLPRTDTSEP